MLPSNSHTDLITQKVHLIHIYHHSPTSEPCSDPRSWLIPLLCSHSSVFTEPMLYVHVVSIAEKIFIKCSDSKNWIPGFKSCDFGQFIKLSVHQFSIYKMELILSHTLMILWVLNEFITCKILSTCVQFLLRTQHTIVTNHSTFKVV